MKKSMSVVVLLPLLIVVLAGVSQAWQGRMGGMGDPYGLMSDESDFLIHPAKFAKGEGVSFYGGYRFTYTGVMDWDYDLDLFIPAGLLSEYYHFDTSGGEYLHDALLGASFPVGPGRMGLFFQYSGERGYSDGLQVNVGGFSDVIKHELMSDLDAFVLRLLYGLPLGGFNLGGEVQFAYRSEEHENYQLATDLSIDFLNFLNGMSFPETNLLPLQFPYDNNYWEALFKGSLEGTVGPLDCEFTLRGGFIFGGDSSLEIRRTIFNPGATVMNGDVEGWQIGGDLWIRYPVGGGLALPFLVRVDYQEKTRDGYGPGLPIWTSFNYNYEMGERDFQIAVGGGADKELGAGTRIAGGIYYNYFQGVKNSRLRETAALFWFDYNHRDYPERTEHQIIVRLAGEHKFTPTVAMRMGLGLFYGWVGDNFVFIRSEDSPPVGCYTDDITLSGYHWGIGASVGGTVQFASFTLEPFVNVGYQDLDLDGDGDRIQIDGLLMNLWGLDLSRSEWYVGGGLSVLFDVP